MKEGNLLKKEAETVLSSIKMEKGIQPEEIQELRHKTGELIEKIISIKK